MPMGASRRHCIAWSFLWSVLLDLTTSVRGPQTTSQSTREISRGDLDVMKGIFVVVILSKRRRTTQLPPVWRERRPRVGRCQHVATIACS
eukprot:scaffold167364_cov39-Tisochrysis_lutea.AAC.1